MNIVTKEKFKEMYFKYGQAIYGADKEYWEAFYEDDKFPQMKYLIDQPEPTHNYSILIVDDFTKHEYRMHFMPDD